MNFQSINMRLVIFFMLMVIVSIHAVGQKPSKSQTQSQMNQFANELNKKIADLEKQIAEAKKNKEDAETIKGLEGQLAMLKNQVNTIGGLTKSVSKMSDETISKGLKKDDDLIVPKKDLSRINMIPKEILTPAEFMAYVKNVHASVEKMIPAEERQSALQEYNEVNAKYKSVVITANAANGFWMTGHWEKALFIMGKVCIDDIGDADNLNNYAAFLIMTGAEHAAIPILDYLNNLYPENSTILNNLGQAWFGLGEIDNARKNLDNATGLYANHSTANETLSRISLSEGDNTKTISFLKASLKEAYDPDKEQQLERMGYTITLADLPPLNFPMKKDPMGIIDFLNSMPENLQTDVSDPSPYYEWQRYSNGIENLLQEIRNEMFEVSKKISARTVKLGADQDYREKYMESYNYSPAYWLAIRRRQLICKEYSGYCKRQIESVSPMITSLILPSPKYFRNLDALPVGQIIKECRDIWITEVIIPINELAKALQPNTGDCDNYEEKMHAFLKKWCELYNNGFRKIKNEFVAKSKLLDYWIKHNLYGSLDDHMPTLYDLADTFVGDMEKNLEAQIAVDADYTGLCGMVKWPMELVSWYRRKCLDEELPDPNPGATDLSHLKKKTIKCEFIKKINASNGYTFELVCNGIRETTGTKNKKRKTEIQKGSGQISKPRLGNKNAPLQPGRGPNGFLDFPKDVRHDLPAPLNAEDKDLSQFSMTYDRWGNLISLDLQLNEDGTALLDETSVESGMDSRWSWNAIASPKKGPLNKLVIK